MTTWPTMTNPATWVAGGASVRGAAHERRGAPNQDAIAWQVPANPNGMLIAAVADGHGAPAHYRSGDGAHLAVESASAVLEAFLDGDCSDNAVAQLPHHVVAAWQNAVRRHAAGGETTGDWVETLDDTLLPYGATLVAVAVRHGLALALQIGDGDLCFGFADGRIERPLPDDTGLVGEQTHSLCESDAVSHVRVAALRTGTTGPDFVMLSTDGLSKSFADDAALREVARHYRSALTTGEPIVVFEQLPAWLETVSKRGSGDDVTLCLGICK